MVNKHNLSVLEGQYVNLREVRVADASFILELRNSAKGKRFLHEMKGGVEGQAKYIEHYLTLDNEWYFIVEDKQGVPVGCLSIYDVKGTSVCTGRWVMLEGLPPQYGIEGDLLLKDFAFRVLGASEIRMSTRHDNRNILAYFRMWGSVKTGEDDEEVYVSLVRATYEQNRARVERFCR